MAKMKEAEFYGIKVSVEDVPLGLYILKNQDNPYEGFAYGEHGISYFEWIAKQVPKDDFIQTLKQMIVCAKQQIKDDIIDLSDSMTSTPETNKEHKLKALHNTERVLSKLLDVLSKKK
ncbi:hypothetical protein KY317_04275 [Candidatus Woesearchaeota archaeon]|nr:hypothetical protein [Candidatus Woesearchaeota archaeon]